VTTGQIGQTGPTGKVAATGLDGSSAAGEGAARRLQGIARFILAATDAQTIEELVHAVADDGLLLLGCNGGAVGVVDLTDAEVLLSYLAASYSQDAQRGYGRLPLSAQLPATVAARTGQAVLVADRAQCLAYSPAMEAVVETTGSQAFASLPLRAGGQVIGVVTAGWDQPQDFDADQMDLLSTFAAQVAQVLGRLQALEAERAAARRVAGMSEALQRSLLAELPEPDHLELVSRYVAAADEAQVGGDWYDAFMVRDGSTSLVVGDVTGHDQRAAVQMAQIRNVLRGIAHAVSQPPATILHALDWAMRDLAVGALATVILAKIEQSPAEAARGLRTLRWSNAGHLPPLLVHRDGRTELLTRPANLLLGLGMDVTRHDHTQQLDPGDTVLLYTDGLVERRGEHLDDGLRRLADTAGRLVHLPLQQLCDELLDRLVVGSEDDVALLAVRAHPENRPRPTEAGPGKLPTDLTRDSAVFPHE
jgi:serine phosphatase RsbU (regulator of sigma subunit)